MLGMSLATLLFAGVALLLRWIAGRENPTIVALVPANTSAVVVTKANTVGASGVANNGGNATNLVHAVPGYYIDQRDQNPMNWEFKKGKERRGIFFRLLGIQFIGALRYLHLSDVRTFRYGRQDGDKEYTVMAKSQHVRYRFFSGQHDVHAKGIETEGALKLNFLFNIIYREVYPVRVRFQVADPFAVLTMMVSSRIISFSGGKEAMSLINDKKLQEQLRRAILKDLKTVEENLGLEIVEVTQAEIDFDEETRKLLEKQITADINAKAAVREAEGKRDAQKALNEGDADRIERVTKPSAATPDLAANYRTDRAAAAYENNKTVTTYAPGADKMVPIGK